MYIMWLSYFLGVTGDVFSRNSKEKQVHLLSPEAATPEQLRVAMEMLSKTSSKVAKLQQDFCVPSSKMDMTTGCLKVRQSLEAMYHYRGEQKALKYKFNTEEQLFATDVFFRIELDLNPRQLMLGSTIDAKTRATKNLEAFELFDNERCLEFAPRFKIFTPNWYQIHHVIGQVCPSKNMASHIFDLEVSSWTHCGKF